jgi:hypothetical protein
VVATRRDLPHELLTPTAASSRDADITIFETGALPFSKALRRAAWRRVSPANDGTNRNAFWIGAKSKATQHLASPRLSFHDSSMATRQILNESDP